MTPIDSSRLDTELKRVLDPEWIEQVARTVGALLRDRKVDMSVFVWTLVLGFGTARDRTLAALRRAYEAATQTTIAPSAFYGRFNFGLVKLLREAVAQAVSTLAEPAESLGGFLHSFKDLVVTDSSIVRLRDLLASAYPACRTNHSKAAAKLHVVMSVLGCGPRSIKITGERTHDNVVLKIGKWVKDRLLLFDLGYYDFQAFDCIRRNGGFFISRLKVNANPLITAVNVVCRGQALDVVGMRLKDVLGQLQRRVLDVQIRVRFQRRVYGGKRAWDTQVFRLVGVYNVEAKRYHLYITNIPVERLTAEQVARTYAARWEVELLFKEMKGFYALEEIPSSNPEVVEALLLATILTAVVSRTLLAAVRRLLQSLNRRLPTRRFAAVFTTIAHLLLQALTSTGTYSRECWKRIVALLRAEVVDPNRSRILNIDPVCLST